MASSHATPTLLQPTARCEGTPLHLHGTDILTTVDCAFVAWHAQDAFVEACDRTDTSQDDRMKDELLAALILTMVCFAIELFSFFSGVSMFNNTAGILCEHTHMHAHSHTHSSHTHRHDDFFLLYF